MNKPTIIITGANGFIGEYLVNSFFRKGWKVKALVHSVPKNRLEGVEYIEYDLEKSPNANDFTSVDYLVHGAYLRFENNKNANEINLRGTKILIGLCRKNNIKSLFISSFSAHKDAVSHYGKTKMECEKAFDLSKDIVLRPGLVIGNKGLASEIIGRIKRSNLFPLIGGGSQPIQTIYIEDLYLVIESALEKNICGLFHVAETEAITMKMFYQEIASLLNKKIIFIPFPLSFLFFICKISEAIGAKLPVSSESVLGLKHLIKFDTKNDLNKFGITLKNHRESLIEVLK
ncbi:MAG: NAD(P)-dependent oxidoreductase [Bacteroidetes bacterium]|nr:NAD(P)-dependent oxidoreductase [Bacteroidota bacterium]